MESKKEKKQKKKLESDEEESEEEKVEKKVKKSKKEDSDDEEEEKVEKKSKKAKKEESDNEEEEEGVDKRAFPLANKVLTKELFQVINKATQIKKIKKGANEATKTFRKSLWCFKTSHCMFYFNRNLRRSSKNHSKIKR